MSEGIVYAPGGGRRIRGGALDATVKLTMDAPALTSSFEKVIPPGYDVGAHIHAGGEEVFYMVEGELDMPAFEPLDLSQPDRHRWEAGSGRRYFHGGLGGVHVGARERAARFRSPDRQAGEDGFSVLGTRRTRKLLRRADAAPAPQRQAPGFPGHRRPAAALRHRAADAAVERPAIDRWQRSLCGCFGCRWRPPSPSVMERPRICSAATKSRLLVTSQNGLPAAAAITYDHLCRSGRGTDAT
jgi:hypothetical protein